MARMRPLLNVAIGGMLGALARWGLLSLSGDDHSVVVIFALNVVGAALLGVALGHRERLTDEQFNLVGIGFAGGLSTFSTYAVAVAQNLEDGELLQAATNGLGTVLIAVLAAGLGFRIARLSGSRRIRKLDRARGRAR